MKIPKEQWQKWASEFADQELSDFCKHVHLEVEQAVILRAKLEAAALYGMELAAVMDARGCDLSEAKDCKPALMRHGVSPPQSTPKEVTLQHGETGRFLVWRTDKPIPKGYAVALWHSAQPCGDCDPCLGGRPDQCAMMPKGKQ